MAYAVQANAIAGLTKLQRNSAANENQFFSALPSLERDEKKGNLSHVNNLESQKKPSTTSS
jgi:hypothetical protein